MAAPGPPKPLTHKPVFQIPPQPPIAASTYFESPFDPAKHITYSGVLPRRHTMAELSFPADQGISPIAVSEPFELFSKDAVGHMRNEVLSDEVWDNCRFSSSLAACQLRGMSPKYVHVFSPFRACIFDVVWISLNYPFLSFFFFSLLLFLFPAAHGTHGRI